MAFNLFFTSTVSNICCFSEIVAVICDAILSAICDGSFNCLIVFMVSLEIFLFIEVNFSNLLIAITDNEFRSSSLLICSA